MSTRRAEAIWNGDLKSGEGTIAFGDGAFSKPYSFKSRFEDGSGTNPEELIAAAHAGCFSMALSNVLAEAGYRPERVQTTAEVELGAEGGDPAITRIRLDCQATVPGIDDADFQAQADAAKTGCPVSKALKAVRIELKATLTNA